MTCAAVPPPSATGRHHDSCSIEIRDVDQRPRPAISPLLSKDSVPLMRLVLHALRA
ncbi:hypothetical protein GZL_08025 [Streptomyces sp. 769]|nr:hypothetical protein GZL_08025 [Streptomyces sp. 769]